MLAMSSVMWMSSSKITALLPLAPTCLPFEPQAAHATTYQTLFSLRRGPYPALQPTLRDGYQLVTESIPTAFGLVILAGGDPMRGVRHAANIGGDTDTIGAIAGAICGALPGIGAVDRALLAEVERLYRPAIEYAARIAEEAGPTTLVVHGAKGHGSREELRHDTRAFLAWIGEEFADLCPCIELLVREEQANKIGDNKAELVGIVAGPSLRLVSKATSVQATGLRTGLGSPKVGICWDLGHDTRNGSVAAPPDFIASVRHVHLHDISPDGTDHCPLIFGNVPYRKRLCQLIRVAYGGIIILEVNGYLVSHFAAAKGVPPSQILWDNFRELGGLTSSCKEHFSFGASYSKPAATLYQTGHP